jgi:hypothetical protein
MLFKYLKFISQIYIVINIFNSYIAYALSPEEVNRLATIDPGFAFTEQIILTTWDLIPKNIKKQIRNNQIYWITKERDIEAELLMKLGFTYSQSYAISTALKNNEILVYVEQYNRHKTTYIPIKKLIIDFYKAYKFNNVDFTSIKTIFNTITIKR